MIDRWHLDLAALGLCLGVIVVVGVVAVSMGWTGRANSAAQRGLGSRWSGSLEIAIAMLAASVAAKYWGGTSAEFTLGWLVASAAVVGLCLWAARASPSSPLGRRLSEPVPMGRLYLVLAFVSFAGIWSAVPDTEPPLVAAMVLVPVAVWRWLEANAAPNRPGAGRPGTGRPGTGRPGTGRPGAGRPGVDRVRPGWVSPGRVALIESIALAVGVVGSAVAGSAGRGAALSTIAVVGMIVWVPVLLMVVGVRVISSHRGQVALVLIHCAVALVFPRAVMNASASVAGGLAILVSVFMAVFAFVVIRGSVATEHGG